MTIEHDFRGTTRSTWSLTLLEAAAAAFRRIPAPRPVAAPGAATAPIVFFIKVHGRSVRSVADELLRIEHVHSVSDVFGSADLIARVLLTEPGDAAFAHQLLDGIDGIDIVMSLPDTDAPKYVPEVPAPPVARERAYIALRAHPAHVAAVLADLARRPEFSAVSRTDGDYNVLTFANARSRSHLADLADDLRATTGIERSETWSISSIATPAIPHRH